MSIQLVIFTGAGFSKAVLGLPTTEDLVDKIDEGISSAPERNFMKNLRDAIQSRGLTIDAETLAKEAASCYKGLDKMNEADKIAPALKIGPILLKDKTNREYDEETTKRSRIKAIINHIHEILFSNLNCDQSDTEKFQPVKRFLNELDGIVSNFNIYSTNYDTLFLDISENLANCRDGRFVDIKKLIQSKGLPYSYIPLKGTIDWRWSDDRKRVIGVRKLGQSLDESVFMGLEFEAKKLEYPFNELYGQFEKDLKKAETLLFIGFSFRDNYINALINKHVKKDQRIIVVYSENSKEEIRAFESRLCETVFRGFGKDLLLFINTGFDDSAQNEILETITLDNIDTGDLPF